MAGMQWIFFVSLHFLILGVKTKSVSDQLQDQGQNRTKPPGQRMCYLVSDSDAKNITVIFSRDDKKLYHRQGRPLPDCPSESGVVKLDNCNVCVREEQVRAECNLTDPLAILNFETSGKTLNKITKTPCGWTTTTTTTTTVRPILTTTPHPVLSATHITLIIVGVVVLLVVVLAVGYCQRKKILPWIMACKERCSHEPVSTDENKTGRTPRHLAANGHGPPSPRPSPRPRPSPSPSQSV